MADAIKDRAGVLGSFPLQVRGKSVPEAVGSQVLLDASLAEPEFNAGRDLPNGKPGPPAGKEQGLNLIGSKPAAMIYVTFQKHTQIGFQEADLMDVSLGPDPQVLGEQVHIFDIQPGKL